MKSSLLDLAESAVQRALQAGADAADAVAVMRRDTDASVREGKLEELEQAEAKELGLRVFVGQSSAVMSSSVIDAAGLAKLVETSLAMARAAPPDPFAGLAEKGAAGAFAGHLDLDGGDLPSAATLKEWALRAEEAALRVPGVTKSSGSGASAARREVALVTSHGFAGTYAKTSASLSVSAIAGAGTGMERDYEYSSALHVRDLKSAEEVGREAGERAARRLNPVKIKSQAIPVIYDRRAASSLVGHLISAAMGNAVARKSSFLQNSLNEVIMPAAISIIDDPHMPRGLASRPFDGEGLPGAKMALIDEGRLRSWFLDLRSARQLGLPPTGHASRGTSSPPSPSSTNVYMEKGKLTREELLKSIKSGVLVTELIGMGTNMVTGDYSRGASGFWIDNGQIAYPVSEITVAGNLKDMFRTLVPADDLEFRSSVNAPSILVEGMTIAGA
jgi:PmbA protein